MRPMLPPTTDSAPLLAAANGTLSYATGPAGCAGVLAPCSVDGEVGELHVGEGDPKAVGASPSVPKQACPSARARITICCSPVQASRGSPTLTDAGHAVTARVFLDERGAPVDFHADRYATLPGGLTLARWRTPVTRWDTAPGRRPLPGPAQALWDLPDGPFPYIEGRFLPDSLACNIPPGHRV
ncbi:hypothetical protein OG762_01570 [Streptomyces sp. NBC_01136]|uniref:DUF6544 family protein n=1 Tax=unclassified Streptomyces TaxID=2593676 RepID=UPI00324DF84E|nr:hypothetical protein OG762_01570 [Streptomyces sp. NBC_01136]